VENEKRDDKTEKNGKVVEMSEKSKGRRIKIGSVILVIFMLIYIPSLLNWLSKDNISSDILRYGLIEESITTEAVLVRDEVLLDTANMDGEVIPKVKEGERIPAFYTVATISDNNSLALLDKLDEINEKIIDAQNERAKKADFFSEDMSKIDDSIGLKINDIIWESQNNTLDKLEQYKSEVDTLMEKKASIAGEDNKDPNMNSLKQQRSQIQQQINSNTMQVTSKYSGIVSYVVDGYESSLKPKTLDKMTPEQISEIITRNKEKKSGTQKIETGKPFIKVIKGNYIYLTAIIDKQTAETYKTGDNIKVRLNDIGEIIPGSVAGVYPKNNEKYLVSIKIDRCSDKLSSLRIANVDLIKRSEEGLKVPLKCLYSTDSKWEKAKIMLIRANCAVERNVVIVCKDEEYALIETPKDEVKKTISLYDTYILNPDNVKEGQIIIK
jgi:hypothetical protein